MPLNLGGNIVGKLYVGNSAVDKVYLGSDEVWSAWTNVGMDKLGTQSVPATTTMLTGWTTRAGYSGPTGDTLVAPGTTNVNIFAKLTLSSSTTTNSALIIYINGTETKRLTWGTSSTNKTWTSTLSVNSGDVITLGFFNDYIGRTLQAGASNTYFYMEKQ